MCSVVKIIFGNKRRNHNRANAIRPIPDALAQFVYEVDKSTKVRFHFHSPVW